MWLVSAGAARGRPWQARAIRNNSLEKCRSGAGLAGGAAAVGRPADRKRLVHDSADGTGAPSALRAAAETAIDLPGRARAFSRAHSCAHVMVAQHVAGAHDHRKMARQPVWYDLQLSNSPRPRSKGKNAEFIRIPMLGLWSTGRPWPPCHFIQLRQLIEVFSPTHREAAARVSASTMPSTTSSISPLSSPSTITRMTGSVPEGRTTSRPWPLSLA